VCGATILIRRWIYGLNHRRIISDSRALLAPTETYACLFADNCTRLRARAHSASPPSPPPLSAFLSRESTLLSPWHLCFLSSLSLPLSFYFPPRYDVSGSFIRHRGFPGDVTSRENERFSLMNAACVRVRGPRRFQFASNENVPSPLIPRTRYA